MDNYQFIVHWILEKVPEYGANIRVLDYGCGTGNLVKQLRAKQINALGCDVFFSGGKYFPENSVLGPFIKRMENFQIPFDNESFDFVVNNQTMEHVQDLDYTLSEIFRVLKPGGEVLSLFPYKGIWREVHCGIPFLHWFPKESRLRIYYAATFRAFGFGKHKNNDKGNVRWSSDACEWLDKWTYYRSFNEIHIAYLKSFSNIRHIEKYWFHQRLDSRYKILNYMPGPGATILGRKLGGLVFVATK